MGCLQQAGRTAGRPTHVARAKGQDHVRSWRYAVDSRESVTEVGGRPPHLGQLRAYQPGYAVCAGGGEWAGIEGPWLHTTGKHGAARTWRSVLLP